MLARLIERKFECARPEYLGVTPFLESDGDSRPVL